MRRLLKTSDDDAFSTAVEFRRITKLEDKDVKKELDSITVELEVTLAEVTIVWLTELVVRTDELLMNAKLLEILNVRDDCVDLVIDGDTAVVVTFNCDVLTVKEVG